MNTMESRLFVPYGNINQRNFSVNVPWSANTNKNNVKE